MVQNIISHQGRLQHLLRIPHHVMITQLGPHNHDQGYIQSPDSGIQLQGTLNKIMETQAQMKQLIDGLVSRVTKLGNSFSSTCSSCGSSPEGKTKRVPTQLSVMM